MKIKGFVLFLSLMVFTSSAFAQFFRTQVSYQVTPYQVIAQVANIYNGPIRCVGRVFGFTSQGLTMWAGFDQIIPMGQFRFAYAHTNAYDPFMSASSDLVCQFVPWY